MAQGITPLASITPEILCKSIDHTLLKAEATLTDIEKLCAEAKEFGFYSVCLNPRFVTHAVKMLKQTSVNTITVVGFPLGANVTATKVRETELALSDGAQEIDLVCSLNDIKMGLWQNLAREVSEVVRVANSAPSNKVPVKVILETAALTIQEISQACVVCADSGASFVKTSTGFHPNGGASLEAVQTMVKAVGHSIKVKASGGIRNLEQATSFLRAGATRLGVSASVSILLEARGQAPMTSGSTSKVSTY